jgi:beta-mannosidase
MTIDLLEACAWTCVATGAGEVTGPSDLAAVGGWIEAMVPGTAAGAVARAQGVDASRAMDFDAFDWWFRTEVTSEGGGPTRLRLEGVATLADVWWDGVLLGSTVGMFTPFEVEVPDVGGTHVLALRCRALRPELDAKRRRPRWRSRLVADQGLRWIRTTLHGRMPALAPHFAPVGPWRPASLVPVAELGPEVVDLRVSVDDGDGSVRCVVTRARAGDVLRVAGVEASFVDAGDGTWVAELVVADVPLWWPHTHGEQPLHDVELVRHGVPRRLARVGFRAIVADRSDDGFALVLNGIPVFVRGVCWGPVDPVGLADDVEETRRTLLRYRAAGLNMVRLVGTATYESLAFWDLCDELGLLVWQDAMLATLDPPEDPEWLALLAAEVCAQLRPLQGRPSLVVVSGGSETEQQPTMYGLPPELRRMTAIEETVPRVVSALLPDVPYVTSSPSGGDLPTHSSSGVAHWFAVGGYRRPLSDTRPAGVRFAAECLAFATPPERASLLAMFGTAAPSGDEWDAGVPRDMGADWTFQDVTDHYVRELVPASVRDGADHGLMLDLQRAVVAHLMCGVFGEWRRAASPCAGGIVLTGRDLVPGPGWGLLDSSGAAKATLLALTDVLAPRALVATDEGLEGLALHLHNDTAAAVYGTLEVTLVGLAGGRESVSVEVRVEAHSSQRRAVDGVIGAFRDVTHAYGFGEPQYAGVLARWLDGDGHAVASLYRPAGEWPLGDPGLTATATHDDTESVLVEVSTEGAAYGVVVEAAGFVADRGWFAVEPGGSRRVRLTREQGYAGDLVATVRALGSALVPVAHGTVGP